MVRVALLDILLLTVTGCAWVTTSTEAERRGGLPTPRAAFESAATTDHPKWPPLFWVPEWRLYLRDGDIVHYAGRYYSFRAGEWYVAESQEGPWSIAGRAGGATRKGNPEPSADAGSSNGAPPRSDGRLVVTTAMRYVGVPYVWGGSHPPGFDCSGFVQYVYGRIGVALPRTVRDQYIVGVSVSRDTLAIGDVVFFDRLRHNGIYIGDGHFIHASKSGDVVKISALDEDWFKRRWSGARRLRSATPPRDAATTVDWSPVIESNPVSR